MSKILVTYATMAGSTTEVAHVIGEEIAKSGVQVDILPIEEIKDLLPYDGVVVGGPMIMGWHRGALRFLKKFRDDFQRTPLAVFIMAMSLTQTGETGENDTLTYIDEKLAKLPEKAGSLNFRERYARISHYLNPVFQAIRPAKPKCIGVFGGRLEYGRLKWWAVLFAMLIIQAPAGDRRNWLAIRSWAADLPAAMGLEEI